MIQLNTRRPLRLLAGCFALILLFTTPYTFALELTEEERAWLAEHPVVRVAADPLAPPFEWIDEDGGYQGISADILKRIEQKLGIEFEIVASRDWADALNRLRARDADVLTAVVRSEERESFLGFTRPYLSLPGVIISAGEFSNVEELAGHKVAVVTGGIWDERISRYDDQISIIRVEDTRTALDLTALGGVDAMVSNLATVSYHIGKQGYANLQIVGRVQEQELELSLGVRSDWAPLLPIMDRALASISQDEIEAIRDKWMTIDKRGFQLNPVYGYLLLGLIALMLLILTGVIAWNRALKHRVEIRTRELQQTEKNLAEARKMESIAQLALGVAHEIKNPLAIMQMGIDFLAQDADRDETERTILKDLDQAVRRSEHIVQSLQVFSRQEQVNTSDCDLNTVITETLREHEEALQKAGIEVSVDLDDELATFPMDRQQLRQALGCLITNAQQAMKEGGRLSIRSKRKRIQREEIPTGSNGLFHPDDSIDWVEITDTGSGISTDTLNRIFDPFFSTLAQGEGFGLGLPIAQNIVKLHNGLIDVQNRPEGGVSVVMIFKLQEGEPDE